MSGTSVNKIIRKAERTVGRIVGEKFRIYRPLDYSTPARESNFLIEEYCSFALNEKFTKSLTATTELFTTYSGNVETKVGDIFSSPSRMFVCVSVVDMEPVLSFSANTLIRIDRAEYTTVGGYSPKTEKIAEMVPAAICSVSSGSVKDVTLAKLSGSGPVRQWEIQVYLPAGFIKTSDMITMQDGTKMSIKSLENNYIGTLITGFEVK